MTCNEELLMARVRVLDLEQEVRELRAELEKQRMHRHMHDLGEQVTRFRKMFGLHVAATDGVPSTESVAIATAKVTEEFFELVQAWQAINNFGGATLELVANLAQEAGDLMFALEGYFQCTALPRKAILYEIYSANMRKAAAKNTAHPDDWERADLCRVLLEHWNIATPQT